jgi:peptide/nickel transport system permease protein
VRRYLTRKLITYVLAFFIGVTVDWALPHFMPGDPIQGMLSKYNVSNTAGYEAL